MKTPEEIGTQIMREYHKTRVQPYSLVDAIADALTSEREAREKAEAECFRLAAGMCRFDLLGDEHGNFTCTGVEAAQEREALARAEADEFHGLLNAEREAREKAEARAKAADDDYAAARDILDAEREAREKAEARISVSGYALLSDFNDMQARAEKAEARADSIQRETIELCAEAVAKLSIHKLSRQDVMAAIRALGEPS